jgi:hypothetical protein
MARKVYTHQVSTGINGNARKFESAELAIAFSNAYFARRGVLLGVEAIPARLTLKAAQQTAEQHAAVIRRKDGEYQVRLNEWLWNHAGVYHTDDLRDALDTARAMREHVRKSQAITTGVDTLNHAIDHLCRVVESDATKETDEYESVLVLLRAKRAVKGEPQEETESPERLTYAARPCTLRVLGWLAGSELADARPLNVCPVCNGDGATDNGPCDNCHTTGRVSDTPSTPSGPAVISPMVAIGSALMGDAVNAGRPVSDVLMHRTHNAGNVPECPALASWTHETAITAAGDAGRPWSCRVTRETRNTGSIPAESAHTVHLSNGTEYAAELCVYRDYVEANGAWRLFWLNPGTTCGVHEQSTVTGRPHYPSMTAAVSYASRRYGIVPRRAYELD